MIKIGSTVKFIHRNVNWQGLVVDIRKGRACVAVLGYSALFLPTLGQCILVES